MKLIKNLLILSLTSVMFITTACEDDDATESKPENATISGVVTFTGTYPDTGSVMLTLDTAYPPQGAPAGFKMIAQTDLDNGNYVYSFSELAFGDFAALTVTYWPNGYSTASLDYTVLGSYPSSLIPPVPSFSLDEDNAEMTIDIDADF
tara:strand:- start:59 stop:505 length:447 start_codon:yes stop_codon:yes gene_type:complete